MSRFNLNDAHVLHSELPLKPDTDDPGELSG